MKVISTVEVTIQRDSVSEKKGHIEIEIRQTDKDDVAKIFTFTTNDILVIDKDTEFENRVPLYQLNGLQAKRYTKTYAEYYAQKEQLSQMFPTDLPEGENDDYWLQMGLLYSLEIDPIYGLTGAQWQAI